MVAASSWEEQGMGNYCLIATEFQFYKMKRVLEMVVMIIQYYEFNTTNPNT